MEEKPSEIIVIPAHNEEETVGFAVGQAMLSKKAGLVAEVVVVDDGSKDRTAEIAANAGATVIRRAENGGKGLAIFDGALYCKQQGAEIMVMADADLVSGFVPAQVEFMLRALKAPLLLPERRGDGWQFLREKTLMVVHAQKEEMARGGCTTNCPQSVAGFRAIRLERLYFLFAIENGEWRHAKSALADRFRKEAFGTGNLEIMLNDLCKEKTRQLIAEYGEITTRRAYRGNEQEGEEQRLRTEKARLFLRGRLRTAIELIRQREEQRRASTKLAFAR